MREGLERGEEGEEKIKQQKQKSEERKEKKEKKRERIILRTEQERQKNKEKEGEEEERERQEQVSFEKLLRKIREEEEEKEEEEAMEKEEIKKKSIPLMEVLFRLKSSLAKSNITLLHQIPPTLLEQNIFWEESVYNLFRQNILHNFQGKRFCSLTSQKIYKGILLRAGEAEFMVQFKETEELKG